MGFFTINKMNILNYIKSIYNSPKLYSYIAYAFLYSGFLLGLYLSLTFGLNTQTKFADLATVFTGTVGLLWSLAGVFFFVYNLQQQKETIELQRQDLRYQRIDLQNQLREMVTANQTARQQQEAIAEQTLNSLFYTVLQNNKKLVEISKDVTTIVKKDIADTLNSYKIFINLKHFNSFSDTEHFPTFKLLRGGNKYDNFKNLMESIVDVIEFIEEKMNGKEMYHKMFFNQLTYNEKYLIGFAFTFGLYDTEKIRTNFNYSKTYKLDSTYYQTENGYFPVLDMKHNNTYTQIKYIGSPNNGYFEFSIYQDILNKEFKLIKVKSILYENNGFSERKVFEFDNSYAITITDGLQIDYVTFLKDFTKENVSVNTDYAVELVFTFSYNAIEYSIASKSTIKFDFWPPPERLNR